MSAELIGSRINGDNIELLAREQHSTSLNSRVSSLRAQSINDSKGSKGDVHGKDFDDGNNVDGYGYGTGKDGEQLVYFSYSFFSPELAYCRAAYYKIAVRVVLLIILLMWATLPIYWGSLYHSAELSGNLQGWIIDRDGGRIGTSIAQTFTSAPTSGLGSIGWTQLSLEDVGDDNSIAQAIISEDAWIAVVISANASTSLTSARQTGNTSYDPTSIITVYYNQARNEVANGNYLIPITTNLLLNATTTFATGSAQRYLAAITPASGIPNATALQLIAEAPQTIAPAVGWRMVNLRPYTAPVAQAVTLVGQIYIIIFSFMTTMAHSSARDIIQRYLTFHSYLFLRLIFPLVAYLPLSLCYTMVSLPFHLPFGTQYGTAGGFFLFFTYAYLSMAALGLSLEAMITLLGPRFIPFFLVLLIIANVSTAALPPELQPGIYSYGAGFPFYNMQQAIRTIIFNTESHLGLNVAVLVAWILMSLGTICIFTWFVRRREVMKRWGPGSPRSQSSSPYHNDVGNFRLGTGTGAGTGRGRGNIATRMDVGMRTVDSIESGPDGEMRFVPISVSGGVEAEDGVVAAWIKEGVGRCVFGRRSGNARERGRKEHGNDDKERKGKGKVYTGAGIGVGLENGAMKPITTTAVSSGVGLSSKDSQASNDGATSPVPGAAVWKNGVAISKDE